VSRLCAEIGGWINPLRARTTNGGLPFQVWFLKRLAILRFGLTLASLFVFMDLTRTLSQALFFLEAISKSFFDQSNLLILNDLKRVFETSSNF
jgi:hypothetical protein